MCGLYGWHLKNRQSLHVTQRAVLAAVLSLSNDKRGGDSWGFFDGKQRVRGVGEAADSGLAFLMAQGTTLLAHTRKATTGSVSKDNSHPYKFGPIVGAHNGMVYNHAEMNKKHGRDFPVDSMHLFAHLADDKDFSEFEGYGTVVWYDQRKPGRIYLCRLSGGQLSVWGLGKDTNDVRGVVWSSDEDHAKEALTVAGVDKYFKYEVKEGQVYFIDGKDGSLNFDGERKLAWSESRRSLGTANQYGLYDMDDDNAFWSQWRDQRGGAGTTRHHSSAPTTTLDRVATRREWAKRLNEGLLPTQKEWDGMVYDVKYIVTDLLHELSGHQASVNETRLVTLDPMVTLEAGDASAQA